MLALFLPTIRPARSRFAALCVSLAGLSACATSTPVDLTGGNAGSAGTGPAHTGGSAGSAGTGGATSTGGQGGTMSTAGQGGAGDGGMAGQGGGAASACPAGSFATGVDGQSHLVCAPFAPAARDAINNGCAVYLGWRDACTGCDLEPTKWGYASGKLCKNGAGADDTCTTPNLDATPVQIFGLNFDGDVNSDDKLYMGLHCPAADGSPQEGPCAPGSFATSLANGGAQCVAAAAPVLDHVRSRCGVYFGWRDACDGCTSAPDRWGQVSPAGCTLGSGATNTCTLPVLGGEKVQLFGLSTGGDVDGNDKLYVALHCDDPEMGTTMTKAACPPGQLITAIAADGTVTCESPAKVVADYFDAHCTLYFGWRDGCDACTLAPDKWGRVRNGFCTNDNGVDNTCTETILGGKTLEMFGLNPDGDVDGNDKLYVGFRCD